METKILIDTNLDEALEKVKKLVEYLDTIENKADKLQFIGIADVIEATGWSPNTVQEIFNDPEFPCCDRGKEKKAEINAARNYFSVPRRKYQ